MLMRFIKASLLVTVLALAAVPAAQAGTMTFGLGGGLAWPSGDFSDFAKMGWNGNVYGDYWVKPNVSIGVDVDGNFFSAKDEVKDNLKAAFPAYQDPKATADLIGGLVHINYAFPMEGKKFEPWVQGGVGFYNVKTKVEDSDPVLANFDDSESDFGYRLGGGLDWATSPTMKFGVDAKWTGVSTKDVSTNFFGVGLHLTFMTNGATQ